MTASLRAEWLKLTTTRTFGGILAAAAATGVLAAFVGTAQGSPPWDVVEPLSTGTAWTLGTLMVVILAVIVGSRTVTEEFDHSTIVHTFVADPQRRRSILAKAVIAALAATAVAAVVATAICGTSYAMAAVTGGRVAVQGADLPAAMGLLGAGATMGVLGTGLGAIVRHPVPAIVGALVWLFVAENLVSVMAGGAAAYLPGKLADVLAGAPAAEGAPSGVVAGALLTAYAIALLTAGISQLRRRDVL